ncbi:type III-B CRISPR module RAMP protein Cmr4 [Paenibacillus sp. S150]|uniref:type III-B CRISPR module RAMP protein Cmr4 n=1 Tax=Paenibacillus sp. S150 TaxID=2749826 RepID=UPI001C576DE0|nr:type III-B CRISPR module RAMP protein Cmr4 [Paenibacillus sp. S150]MBW4082504.1 type III-B CRISPR module RAMP protein Cmr4 [Paenibacillus sp. S150]
MESNSKLYFVQCLSPVHIGAGQGTGIVDMPMIREKATQWPLLPGSSMKGVHREYFRLQGRDYNQEWLNAAFGKASGSRGEPGNAGALVLSDGRILAFPVASRYGTFAYVTCPLVLKRLRRDLSAAGIGSPELDFAALESRLAEDSQAVAGSSQVIAPGMKLYIDEFTCRVAEDTHFARWADWLAAAMFLDGLSRRMLTERMVLVTDEAFQYFVTACSEIVPRIRITPDSGTVQDGALWYEEYLPAESLLYGVVWCDKIHGPVNGLTEQKLLAALSGEAMLQIGGNATVGKGRIRLRFTEGGAR